MSSPHQLHVKAASPSNGFVTHSLLCGDDHSVSVPGKHKRTTLLQRGTALHTFKPSVYMHVVSLQRFIFSATLHCIGSGLRPKVGYSQFLIVAPFPHIKKVFGGAAEFIESVVSTFLKLFWWSAFS